METSLEIETRSGEENPSRIIPVHLTPNFGTKFSLRGKVCNIPAHRTTTG
jgi:hypothetical protein